MIHLNKLSKIFKDGIRQLSAVNQVNLDIKQGEIFGIIGYSGAGKSTLLRMINVLERPTQGDVVINQASLTQLKGRELRKQRQEIGMIFQHFNLLWSRTVRQNIAFPLEIAGLSKEKRDERVTELIKLVGLEGKEDFHPSQLSGGQKQRVGIARALANKPKVLLCDEATSALDPKTTDSILTLLQSINQTLGLTIVLITHEMHVIRKICDRVAVMENGEIVELGRVIDVFQQPQQKITKEFVHQITEPEEAIQLSEWGELSGIILQCHFMGEAAGQPVISKLIRQFALEVNFLQGKISRLKESSYGSLILQINGDPEEIKQGISFLEAQGVKAEVLHHG